MNERFDKSMSPAVAIPMGMTTRRVTECSRTCGVCPCCVSINQGVDRRRVERTVDWPRVTSEVPGKCFQGSGFRRLPRGFDRFTVTLTTWQNGVVEQASPKHGKVQQNGVLLVKVVFDGFVALLL